MSASATPAIPHFDYSPTGESVLLRRYLPCSISRTLIEIEAGDGITHTLSRALLIEGWRGLLVESNPELFSSLVESARMLSGTICVHATCCMHNISGQQKRSDTDAEQPPPEYSLNSLLADNRMPEIPGLLILNQRSPQIDVIRELDPVQFQPSLVVASDEMAPEDLHFKYDLLSTVGYRFAGTIGSFSVWTWNAIRQSGNLVDVPMLYEAPQMGHGTAAFDSIEGGNRNMSHRDRLVNGWAFTSIHDQPPPVVVLEIHDEQTNRTEYRQAERYPRPDVAAYFRSPNLLMSGFRAIVNLDMRSAKGFTVRVLQLDHSGVYSSDAELPLRRTLEPFEHTAREGLAAKFLSGSGIEIGALQRRLRVPETCRVRYVDRMRVDDLLRHYPELQEYPLQAPDLIDNGEELQKIAGNSQDFVIANHFFEHSENPIRTLMNLLRVIRPGGVLFMAVPDKNYTFDFARPLTNYEALKQTFMTGIRADRESLFRDWAAYVQNTPADTVEARGAELLKDGYSIHFNVWTVDSLLEFLLRARAEFGIPFEIVSWLCCDNEAIALLERKPTPSEGAFADLAIRL